MPNRTVLQKLIAFLKSFVIEIPIRGAGHIVTAAGAVISKLYKVTKR